MRTDGWERSHPIWELSGFCPQLQVMEEGIASGSWQDPAPGGDHAGRSHQPGPCSRCKKLPQSGGRMPKSARAKGTGSNWEHWDGGSRLAGQSGEEVEVGRCPCPGVGVTQKGQTVPWPRGWMGVCSGRLSMVPGSGPRPLREAPSSPAAEEIRKNPTQQKRGGILSTHPAFCPVPQGAAPRWGHPASEGRELLGASRPGSPGKTSPRTNSAP